MSAPPDPDGGAACECAVPPETLECAEFVAFDGACETVGDCVVALEPSDCGGVTLGELGAEEGGAALAGAYSGLLCGAALCGAGDGAGGCGGASGLGPAEARAAPLALG